MLYINSEILFNAVINAADSMGFLANLKKICFLQPQVIRIRSGLTDAPNSSVLLAMIMILRTFSSMAAKYIIRLVSGM